jgi:hypothetical protein
MERRLGVFLWFLTVLFALRVGGQAIQRWAPQPYLPPFDAFDAFQGSNLPYAVLFASQLAILALMCALSYRMARAALEPRRRVGWVLLGVGSLYMMGALGRIALGMLWQEAPSWFRTWIPASLHVVLATFVLALSFYHLRKSRLT